MKQLLTIALTLIFAMPLSAQTPTNTYEDIQQQVEEEANHTVRLIHAKFSQENTPAIIRMSLSSIAFGVCIPLAIQASKNNRTPLACLFSGLASLAGYLTLLEYSELKELRKMCDMRILDADRIYHKKMAHIHTRHYLGDIAKFQMYRLEEIVKEYLAQNALPKDKNQQ